MASVHISVRRFCSPMRCLTRNIPEISTLYWRKKDFYWRNALFDDTEDQEIGNLIMAGRRSTWPKVPMIRNPPMIGRTFGEIPENLDMDELSNSHTSHKQHITQCA